MDSVGCATCIYFSVLITSSCCKCLSQPKYESWSTIDKVIAIETRAKFLTNCDRVNLANLHPFAAADTNLLYRY